MPDNSINMSETIQEYLNKLPFDVQEYYRGVIEGKYIISVKKDLIFKLLLDPDEHGDRLGRFLTLLMGFEVNVIGSLMTENIPRANVGKKSILDILARTESGAYIIVEIQVEADEFITERMALYSSEVLVRQYSIEDNQKKGDIGYSDMKKVYTIALMDKSPAQFAEQKDFIHYFQQTSKTDPEFKPNFLQEYIFVEMGKFMEIKPYDTKESSLYDWLRFIADDTNEAKQKLSKKDNELLKMYKELIRMSSDKAILFDILETELYEFDQRARLNQARKEGRMEGKMEGIAKAFELFKNGYTIEQVERLLNEN